MKDKAGNIIYRRIVVSVQLPGGKWKKREWLAPPKQAWNEKGIEGLLDNIAHAIEKDFPVWNYRLVELAPNWFKFVNEGVKDELLESLNGMRLPHPVEPLENLPPQSDQT